MPEYSSVSDFTGMMLVIPDKTDIERDAVAKAWERHGGNVIRIGRFWEPPKMEREKIRLYGNHIFCMILAQKLNLELISPPDDILMHLPEKWLKRTVKVGTLAEAEQFGYPCFIKPLAPKIFAARKYNSYSELLEECKQLDDITPIVCSDIVDISSEVRSFILNGQVFTASVYEGEADINDAKAFLKEFISENLGAIPSTCVIDIGYINGSGWGVIEANAIWGAGLNGCDPLTAAMCIAEATKMEGI